MLINLVGTLSNRYFASMSASMIARFSAIFFSLAISVPSPAAPGAEESFLVEMWDVERGLPNSTITSVVQSPDGYLWLSTLNGLVRFDGVRFRSFVSPAYPGLKVGGFNQIAVGGTGEVWARAESGELIFRDKAGFTTLKQSGPDAAVLGLWTGTDGAVWATLANGALARCAMAQTQVLPQSENYGGLASAPVALPDGRSWLVTVSGALLEWNREGKLEAISPPGAANQRMVAIAKDSAGAVWVLGENAIWNWHGEHWTPVALPEKARASFLGLKAGRDGSVWVWSDQGVWRLRLGAWLAASDKWPAVIGALTPATCLVDRDGCVWFGTAGHGLVAVNVDGQVTNIAIQQGLPSNYILCLAQDHEGNVWAGTRRGLVRVKRSQINVVSWDKPLGESVATGLAEIPGGGLWLGSDGQGLWHLEDENNSAKPKSFSPNPKSIRALVLDRQDRLWVGTVREGLWRLESNGLQRLYEGQLPREESRSLLADSRGRLWIGTSKGLFSVMEGKLTAQTAPPELGTLDVRALLEDRDGSLWIGTQGQGLLRWREGAWEQVGRALNTAPLTVWSLYQDRAGDLWAGTGGWGLARWRAGRFTFLNRTNGLPVDDVLSILEDDQNDLWLGTLEGIIRLKTSDCRAVSDGAARKVEPRLLTRSDGLPTLQCAAGFQPNACRTRDGRLWFPTVKGVVVVNPNKEIPRSEAPSVVIEEVVVQGRSLAAESGLRLGPHPRRVEFRFTALSFSAPERVRFRYRLDGAEKEWIDVGTDRTVTFDALLSGDHEFSVTACNGDGVWSERGVSLRFSVVPIWWQTWWFRGGFSSGVFLLAGLIWWRIATRRLQRRLEEAKRQGALERERARIARDIHDELGTSLTRIIMLSQPPDEDEAPASPELSRIHATACDLTRAMDEVVWAVNPRQDTLEGLVAYVSLFAQEFIGAANLGCRLDLPERVPPVPLLAEARHNVFLAAKEAIHNAVRHSQAREIRIALQIEEHRFTLEVADDGIGFDPNSSAKTRGGHGLQNMRERLNALGGTCEINGLPQKGTSVRFAVPLPVPDVV